MYNRLATEDELGSDEEYLRQIVAGSPAPAPAPITDKFAQWQTANPIALRNAIGYGYETGQTLGSAGYQFAPEELAQWALSSGSLTQQDLDTIKAERAPALAPAPAATLPLQNQFYDFMYAAGQDPALATQRGIQYARQQGWTPEQTTQQWNQALGTNFTLDDFYRVTGLTPESQTFASASPKFSNFGEAGSWDFGQGAVYDTQTNLIKAPGTVFQSGKDAIVSDELFWNPHSVTGEALQKRIQDTQAQGQRAGVVITPYAVFQGKATNEQLLNEIKNSGTDFVTIDPYYLGFGPSSKELIDWAKSFIPQVNALGKEVKLVTQGFAPKGQEQQTLEHNQKMLSLPGVSEFINFGLEDAKDLQGDPNWVSIGNDYGQVQPNKTGLASLGGEPAAAPALAPAPVAWEPIAQQISQQWQQYGIAPEIQGINRANELAQILANYGITDISKLGVKQTPYEEMRGGFTGSSPESGDYVEELYKGNRGQLTYGDQTFGRLGGFGSGGQKEFSTPQEYLTEAGNGRYGLGYSAAGKGWTDYEVVVRPDGTPVIVPRWGSSSDIDPGLIQFLSIAAMPFTGGLSAALGGGTATLASTIAANALVSGTLGGLGAEAQGGSFGEGFGKGALTGGITAGIGSLASPFASSVGAEVLAAGAPQWVADAATAAVRAGAGALPQAVISGDFGNVLSSALTAGATAGAVGGASELTGFSTKDINAAVNFAQGAAAGDYAKMLGAASSFTDSPDLALASKAASLVKAIETGNPAAIVAAGSAFGKELDNRSTYYSKTDTGDETARLLARYGTADDAIIKQIEAMSPTGTTAAPTTEDVQQAIINDVLRQSPTQQVAPAGTEVIQQAIQDDLNRELADIVYLNADSAGIKTQQEAAQQASQRGLPGFIFQGQTYRLSQAPGYLSPEGKLYPSEAAYVATLGPKTITIPGVQIESQGRTAPGVTAAQATQLGQVPLRGETAAAPAAPAEPFVNPAVDYTEAATGMQGTALSPDYKPTTTLADIGQNLIDVRQNINQATNTGIRTGLSQLAGTGLRAAEVIGSAFGTAPESFAEPEAGMDELTSMLGTPPSSDAAVRDVQKELYDYQKSQLAALPNDAQRAFASGVASTVNTVASYALGGPFATVANAAANTGNLAWMQGKEAGLTPEDNAKRSAFMAGVEAVGELAGVPFLKALFKEMPMTGSKDALTDWLATKLKAYGGEQLTENLTTAGQFAVDKFADFGIPSQATDFGKALGETIIATTAAFGGTGAISTFYGTPGLRTVTTQAEPTPVEFLGSTPATQIVPTEGLPQQLTYTPPAPPAEPAQITGPAAAPEVFGPESQLGFEEGVRPTAQQQIEEALSGVYEPPAPPAPAPSVPTDTTGITPEMVAFIDEDGGIVTYGDLGLTSPAPAPTAGPTTARQTAAQAEPATEAIFAEPQMEEINRLFQDIYQQQNYPVTTTPTAAPAQQNVIDVAAPTVSAPTVAAPAQDLSAIQQAINQAVYGGTGEEPSVRAPAPSQVSAPATGTILSTDPTQGTALVVDPQGNTRVVDVDPASKPGDKVGLGTTPAIDPSTPVATDPVTGEVIRLGDVTPSTPSPAPAETKTEVKTEAPTQAPVPSPAPAETKAEAPAEVVAPAPAPSQTLSETKAEAPVPSPAPVETKTEVKTEAPAPAEIKPEAPAPAEVKTEAPAQAPVETKTEAKTEAPAPAETKAEVKTEAPAPAPAPAETKTEAPAERVAPTETKVEAPAETKAEAPAPAPAPAETKTEVKTEAPAPSPAPAETKTEVKTEVLAPAPAPALPPAPPAAPPSTSQAVPPASDVPAGPPPTVPPAPPPPIGGEDEEDILPPVSPEPPPPPPPPPPSVDEDVFPPVTEEELRQIVSGPTPAAPTPAPPAPAPAPRAPAPSPAATALAQLPKAQQAAVAQLLQEIFQAPEADLLEMFAELSEEREQKRKERGAQSKSRKA